MDYLRDTGEMTNNAGTRDQLTGVERVICVDAETGEQVWEFEYPCTYKISYPGGPRCSPVVADGKVYALGAEGDLHVLEADSGKPIWSKNFNADYNSEINLDRDVPNG